jgi:hypothetical protein
MEFWQNLSAGQGAVMAAIITLIALVGSVWLGGSLFGGRVTTLEGAAKAIEARVQEHLRTMETVLEQLKEDALSISQQVGRLSSSVDLLPKVGQLSGSVDLIPTSSPAPAAQTQQTQQDPRDIMLDSWGRIRDRLEAIAAAPEIGGRKIDGRTRARYARMDRRRYAEFVDALDADGLLGSTAKIYRDALELWQKYRTGRIAPTAIDVKKMKDLDSSLPPVAPVAEPG